jgi:hypothetical protein
MLTSLATMRWARSPQYEISMFPKVCWHHLRQCDGPEVLNMKCLCFRRYADITCDNAMGPKSSIWNVYVSEGMLTSLATNSMRWPRSPQYEISMFPKVCWHRLRWPWSPQLASFEIGAGLLQKGGYGRKERAHPRRSLWPSGGGARLMVMHWKKGTAGPSAKSVT